MKVYLVYCLYYDNLERNGGSLLLGVYSSMDGAIAARNDFVAKELAECAQMNYPTRQAIDDDNNPVIEKILNGEIAEECTYAIEEWVVQ